MGCNDREFFGVDVFAYFSEIVLPLPIETRSPHIPCGPSCQISGCPLLGFVIFCYRCVGLFQIEENG